MKAENIFRDYTHFFCDRAYFRYKKIILPNWSQQEAGLIKPNF